MLLPEWWGRGYATEAVRGVLGWARDRTPDASVLICTQLANERSMAVAQRLGSSEVDIRISLVQASVPYLARRFRRPLTRLAGLVDAELPAGRRR